MEDQSSEQHRHAHDTRDMDEWARNFGIRPEEMQSFERHQENDKSRER